jgi:glutathione S-transferase
MPLRLYFHPLASFCWKVLIPLYENATPFEPLIVDLGDAKSRAAFAALWPTLKFPVLRDETRNRTVAEATVIIEYLDAYYPGSVRFVPRDTDAAWQARMWDRFYDHYVHEPMQKIVTDNLRPEESRDSYGVAQAEALIRESYAILDSEMEGRTWAMGDAFSLVDCATSPALFYANTVAPFGAEQKNLPAYLDRLMARPSFARVLKEAEPYFQNFPMERKPKIARR